ncbi:TonB-dependent receptor plug domain-containing protein [Loktanella sp. R86503]|uniref:TonB-dependent receptor plug domain-containing protein n=1 Tax=Loktanella sp. R86503 TaxID=3093847 RepID=UPI0036DA41A9
MGNDTITEAEIEARNPATVADVFAGESGVLVGGGASIAQRVFVNGIEESLLSVTIDGARQNKSAFHHAGNVLLDPALLKSVDVSAGLAPAD